MSDGADVALAETRHWLERVVIGLGLCPFAAAPYRGERILFRACTATSDDKVYAAFVATVDELLSHTPERQETALLVLTRALAGFEDYLEMLGALEHAIEEAGLSGVLQLASFHPDYRFEGVDADDPSNWTNRSPFPVFHLIREAGLAEALASYPDPERIPERNVALLRKIGVKGIRSLLEGT